MKRVLLLAVALCGVALAAPPKVMPDALKQLCDRICGGVWEPDAPPVPDQFVTTYSFAWDEASGLIRGSYTTTGGFAGVHDETLVVYGFYEAGRLLWTMRASGQSRPNYGTVTTTPDGFTEQVKMIGGLEGYMLTTYSFDGTDTFTTVAEIHAPGGVTVSSPETYRRRR